MTFNLKHMIQTLHMFHKSLKITFSLTDQLLMQAYGFQSNREKELSVACLPHCLVMGINYSYFLSCVPRMLLQQNSHLLELVCNIVSHERYYHGLYSSFCLKYVIVLPWKKFIAYQSAKLRWIVVPFSDYKLILHLSLHRCPRMF